MIISTSLPSIIIKCRQHEDAMEEVSVIGCHDELGRDVRPCLETGHRKRASGKVGVVDYCCHVSSWEANNDTIKPDCLPGYGDIILSC